MVEQKKSRQELHEINLVPDKFNVRIFQKLVAGRPFESARRARLETGVIFF